MTILDHIIANKYKEVAVKKEAFPISLLEKSALFNRETTSLAKALRSSGTGIIAEHKRRSPSKSVINNSVLVQDVARAYELAGAIGMSVLTDTNYFGGSLEDLLLARSATSMPLLRKDFIVDSYQVVEAKSYGADAILLIAACLKRQQLIEFSALAKDLGMDVLLEIHNEEELKKSMLPTADLLGVNNRNLKTFEVSLDSSKELSALIPNDFVKVSESGISSIAAIKELQPFGYKGFLIGENFMKTENPGETARKFINELK